MLINYGIFFLTDTTPGIDDGFAQIKVLVEFGMENRCAEIPGVLCGFAVLFCNIPANLFELILKHTIIHLCLSKLRISCQNLYFWWFTVIYLFIEFCCSLWEILFSWKPKKCTSKCQFSWAVTFWTKEIFTLWFIWFYHPKTLGHTGVIFKQCHYEDWTVWLPDFPLD